jgi:hypothetical protein
MPVFDDGHSRGASLLSRRRDVFDGVMAQPRVGAVESGG